MHSKVMILLSIAASLFAAKAEFSGNLNTDLWSHYPIHTVDDEFELQAPDNYSYHEIFLNSKFTLDEGVFLDFTLATYAQNLNDEVYSTSSFPYGKAKAEDADSKFSGFELYGYQAGWEFQKDATISIGHFPYSSGAVENLRTFGNIVTNSGFIKEHYITGLGFDAGGLIAYVGVPDSKNRSFSFFTSFDLEFAIDKNMTMALKPTIEYTSNQGRSRNLNIGSEYSLSGSTPSFEYQVDGVLGLQPYHDEKTYTVLIEPAINFGVVSLGMGYYQAFLAMGDVAANLQTDLEVEQFAYIEPLFELHEKVSLGLPVSWYNTSTDVEGDDNLISGVSVYLYPTEKTQVLFWGDYQLNRNDFLDMGSDESMTMGIEASLEF